MAAELLPGFHWLGHATFRIEASNLVLYFDPWQLKPAQPKADIIFITHDHHDHCSPEDVAKIARPDTIVIGPPAAIAALEKEPGQRRAVALGEEFTVRSVAVRVVAAYNVSKRFHPDTTNNVGYVVAIGGVRIYHAGDTDLIPEMGQIQADVVLLPIGGTYTMNPEEAAAAVRRIGPRIAIPMHYGRVVGELDDAHRFAQLVEDAEVAVLPEE
jgi:L-ascorbate metabolism protein UlaG (beta-lactamase superfamily)